MLRMRSVLNVTRIIMSPSNRQGWFFNVIVTVLLIGVVVVMGLLILQNRDLKARLAAIQTEAADVPELEIGDVVDGFNLPALDGTMTRLDFSAPGSETLLLFFSPDCPACDENFAGWVDIEQGQRHENRRIIYISTVPEEQTRRYVADKDLESEVLIADRSVLDRYKVFQIPATVLVGTGGVVSGVWIGILPDTVVSEL